MSGRFLIQRYIRINQTRPGDHSFVRVELIFKLATYMTGQLVTFLPNCFHPEISCSEKYVSNTCT